MERIKPCIQEALARLRRAVATCHPLAIVEPIPTQAELAEARAVLRARPGKDPCEGCRHKPTCRAPCCPKRDWERGKRRRNTLFRSIYRHRPEEV